MPYVIQKNKGKAEWCVFKEGNDGKPMGESINCHISHEKALGAMRAIYANEGKSFLFLGEEMKAKKKDGSQTRSASHFLVVEDPEKPSTWHLPVYKDGKLSPRLLGAAHAALTVGYRGNKYEGPGKEEALAKLKRLYKKAGLKWPERKEESTKKSIQLYELEQKVRDAVRAKISDATGCEEKDMPWFSIDTYNDFALAHAPAGLYQIPYAVDAESYEVSLGEPTRVKIEYIPDDIPPEDMADETPEGEVYHEMMMHKDIDLSVKMLGSERIGGYAVLWGDENKRDLTNEFFDSETDELTTIFDTVGRLPYLFHHGLDDTLKTTVIGIVDTLVKDDVGLWFEAQMKKAKDYKEHVQKLVEGGVKKLIENKQLKTSTATLPVARRVNKDNGRIERWPIIEITGTPTPAEHRLPSIEFLKSAFGKVGCTDFYSIMNKFGVQDAEASQGAVKARLLAEIEQARLEIELV